jgi:hypothetical protein
MIRVLLSIFKIRTNKKQKPMHNESKTKKLCVELPHYAYRHSTSDVSSTFIGRNKLVVKLEKFIVNSSNKTGVYLITGERGVGKSSLVNHVAAKTSLKFRLPETVRYLLFLFLAVHLFQYSYNTIYENFYDDNNFIFWVICIAFILLWIIAFGCFCHFNSLNRYGYANKHWVIKYFWKPTTAGFKELCSFTDTLEAYMRMQYALKVYVIVFLIVSFSYIIPLVIPLDLTPLKMLSVYVIFVIIYRVWKFSDRLIFGKYQEHLKQKNKNDKELNSAKKTDKSIHNEIKNRCGYVLHLIFIFFSLASAFCFVIFGTSLKLVLIITGSILILELILLSLKCAHWAKKTSQKKRRLLCDTIIHPFEVINKYIKNNHRIYLKINFGHKSTNEKHILRLICRTLLSEYRKFTRSISHMLLWRFVALGFIILFTHLFYLLVYKPNILPYLENTPLYKASSQIYINDSCTEEQELYRELSKDILSNNDIITNDIKSLRNSAITYLVILRTYTENFPDKNALNTILIAVDQIIFDVWNDILLLPDYFWNYKASESEYKWNKTSKKPVDYAWCLIFIFTYLLSNSLLSKFGFFTYTTHRNIKKQLNELNDAITYSIEKEENYNLGIEKKGLNLFGGLKRKKIRAIADEREIEKWLQDILQNIQNIPTIMCRPDFVIVFDELDKIDPDEMDDNPNAKTKASIFSIKATRERQSAILKVLSNLKYFLTSADAKFIFIAGREIYDIFLADVSDRNNFIGSIFNGVINVPSFLSDNSDMHYLNVTSLTEEYVCRRIIPAYYIVDNYDLTNYRYYLEDLIYTGKTDDYETKMKIHKIIAVLQQFIIYLSYVSKGAPKKMVQIFESFIDIHKRSEFDNNNIYIRLYKNSKLFLSFNYSKQYLLGMTSYLVSPIIYRFSDSNIREYSDKLLLSSLRFTDFLFKFHNHNFSWSNLDTSQEMVEINKAPELKDIVTDILKYMTQVHIDNCSGLYEYRFNNLISQELSFMTKVDENFSALFNFSLDESLALKQYYMELLDIEIKKYPSHTSKFINSISSLQITLGDLHFYDDQLDEAENYYKDSMQVLRYNDLQKTDNTTNEKDVNMRIEQLYLFVRNMLKIGIIYEKKKQYSFAYFIYGELCKKLIRERNFEMAQMGIAVRRKKGKLVFVKTYNNNIDKELKKYYDNIEIPELNANIGGYPKEEEIKDGCPCPLTFRDISPSTYNLLFEKVTFESLKLLYLPFLTKFQILEKSSLSGILRSNIQQLECEFEFLTRAINHIDIHILKADFYARAADILYYKNRDFNIYSCKDEVFNMSKENDTDIKNKYKISPCTACYYYKKSLLALLNKPDNTKIMDLLIDSIDNVRNTFDLRYCNMMGRLMSDWGNVFFSCDKKKVEKCPVFGKRIKDTKAITGIDRWLIWFQQSDNDAKSKWFKNSIVLSKMEIACAMYALAMKAYRKTNNHKRSAYQVNKILQLFKCYFNDIKDKRKLPCLIKTISKQAIHSIYVAYDDSIIHGINKRKKEFDKQTINDDIPLAYILVDSEINRLSVLVNELNLKLDISNERQEIIRLQKQETVFKRYYELNIASPYGINYSVSDRIHRLRFKADLNWKTCTFIAETCECKDENRYIELLNILTNNTAKQQAERVFGNQNTTFDMFDIMSNMIAESIFCLKEIIRLSKTIGETYLFNHSFLGSVHYKLYSWVSCYEAYIVLLNIVEKYKGDENTLEEKLKTNNNSVIEKAAKKIKQIHHAHNNKDIKIKRNQIKEKLKTSLGTEWYEQLSSYYETEQALSHYYKCIETHEGGKSYYSMIDSLVYVNEDFHDFASHFNIALERHKLYFDKCDTKNIQKRIEKLKVRYRDTSLHIVERYAFVPHQ